MPLPLFANVTFEILAAVSFHGRERFSISVYFWCRVDLKHRKYAVIAAPWALLWSKSKNLVGCLSFQETLNRLISVLQLILAGKGLNGVNQARISAKWDATVVYSIERMCGESQLTWVGKHTHFLRFS